ncbi:hypothetical protein CathTA2_0181 [Caldalkalibacillus thermarum TA2.A1]|uniref:Uncharacterized protein n=1 Tax=Caldalkalibacillus thermarum (strain TA2.A1) TaxID=986075 RepID=F5L321_CALTT|nr:hypothetical protein [Caldalkalibacillus thermarum]EGL84261.1 hypothetical protein CathTA2_0181 [Caldalkalibacillus thermarum TA2.A1]QZT33644.1 hypothetical protein HUR95_15660 [Caldalkalibacillus thermarum TA2.A1]
MFIEKINLVVSEKLLQQIASEQQRQRELLTQLISIIKSTNVKVSHLDSKVSQLDSKMTQIDQKVSELENTVGEILKLQKKQENLLQQLSQGQERQDKILETLALRSLEQETEIREMKRIK